MSYKPIRYSNLGNALTSDGTTAFTRPGWNYTVNDTLTFKETDKMGYIEPKALTVRVREANKEFDGTAAVNNAGKNLVLVGLVDANQTTAPFTVKTAAYFRSIATIFHAACGRTGTR